MNYEEMTFETIMQRMLDRIPDNMDKREGSIIYDALAPAAIELAILYTEFGNIENEIYADTASRESLIRRASERGIVPFEATKAVVKAVTTPANINLQIGARFNSNDLNYEVIEKESNGIYYLQCETYGVIGNTFSNTLIPIDYIQNLESVEITELLIPGEDEESTESLRERYFETFNEKAFSGNVKDYIQKTNAIPGVGATKVTPVWNGGGTVLLTILDSNFNKASSTLLEKVQEEIDPSQDSNGLGLAPIGHIVTVNTVEEEIINIQATFNFDSNYSFTNVKNSIEKVLNEYLLELRKSWSESDEIIVRVRQIETRILAIEGILDIYDTKINSVSSNLTLDKYKIPVFGEISE